jgi:Mor family transcriptional regulator
LVTNEQLYILVGVPMLFNATLIGLVIALFNAKFGRFEARFDALDKRFDDMRDLWRAELRRVEEVLDARLKHIEERG